MMYSPSVFVGHPDDLLVIVVSYPESKVLREPEAFVVRRSQIVSTSENLCDRSWSFRLTSGASLVTHRPPILARVEPDAMPAAEPPVPELKTLFTIQGPGGIREYLPASSVERIIGTGANRVQSIVKTFKGDQIESTESPEVLAARLDALRLT